MPYCKIEIDNTTHDQLIAIALHEWRPTQWQAETLFKHAVRRAYRKVRKIQETQAPEPEPADTGTPLSYVAGRKRHL